MTRTAIGVALLLCSCAAPRPDWAVRAGRGDVDASPDCAHSRFGVGEAEGVSSPSLRERTARDRARADLARRLRSCWSARLLGKLPRASEVAPEEAKATLESTLDAIVEEALADSVARTWSPGSGALFVLIEAPPRRE